MEAGTEAVAAVETVRITGLGSAEELTMLQDVLDKVAGIKSARPDAALGTLDIDFDPALAGVQDVVNAMQEAGFRLGGTGESDAAKSGCCGGCCGSKEPAASCG